MLENKNIVLCGFMGCGKSTIGKQLAKELNRELIDLDDYIEQKEKMKITEIFSQYGEEHFRDLEHMAVKELSNKNGLVISSGGGTLIFERNVEILKENSVIIYLESSLEEIKDRLKNDTKRPLLQKPNKDEIMQELYNKRVPIYKKSSDYTVNSDKTIKLIVKDICELIVNK